MALQGTITVSTCGNAVLFSTSNTAFRASSLYLYNLTAGNSALLDISATSGNSTGFTVPPTVLMQFPQLSGIRGFSVIASTAAGSLSLSYLASR
jgi:hypothetical protein